MANGNSFLEQRLPFMTNQKNVDADKGVGVLKIKENGLYSTIDSEKAEVKVAGVVPTGEFDINDNGTFDVINYASVKVEVQKGITPSGTLNITENGSYNVTEKATVDVSVPEPGPDTSLLPDFFVPFMDESEMGPSIADDLREFIFLISESSSGYNDLRDFLTNLKYKAKFPLSEETRSQLEDVVIYYMESASDFSADIYYYPVNDSSKKLITSVAIESEAETGDYKYIFGEILEAE